jgi:excisionase family DNA binding protein
MPAEDVKTILDEIAEKVAAAIDMRPLLTVPQVAERLQLSDRTVWAMTKDGRLATITVAANQVRVEPGELDRYIQSRKETRDGE